MDTGLDGKVAIVTGAARGLGQEFAKRLAAEGAAVIAGDVRDCDDTAAQITGAGGKAIGLHMDVADMDSCQAVVDKAVAEFGRVDVLVNNAALYGGLKGGRFESLSPDEWQRVMDVNVTGIWHCCKAAVPAMRDAGGGSIINISSLAAVYGLAYALHYTVSKAAVIGITRGLARELGRDWIRVNSIGPSAVMTEGTAEFFGDRLEKGAQIIASQQSLNRNLETEDLAGTVIFLAGDQSKFVTGQTIMVDGGTTYL
jgi:3-oxoacyl-[acyl-carrier protein] reductase